MRLEAARAAIEETAERIDAGEGSLNTEGAIAKYLATEAGNAAADAAIQAHGGYGYTHEYMVEKIKRDVRITTIYEGTSEIMEMTIARDRWQEHLKTRGDHYHEVAGSWRRSHAGHPDVWGRSRGARHPRARRADGGLPHRPPHPQPARAPAAGRPRRAGRGRGGARAPRGPGGRGNALAQGRRRFGAAALGAMSRVNARDAALSTVAAEGIRWVTGADGGDLELAERLGLPAIHAAQAGLLADMDAVADHLYGERERWCDGRSNARLGVR